MGVRRFEHDFTPTAGPTLSDPARGKLRAGSWVGLRRKIARRPFGLGPDTGRGSIAGNSQV